MMFKRGDKVKCIDAGTIDELQLGKIYTIRHTTIRGRREHVYLMEDEVKDIYPFAYRFEKAYPKGCLN